jgi:hypothetical protein
MHGRELLGEDCFDCAFVICVMGEVEEDRVGASSGVLARVNPREVLVFNEDRVVRW